ncbi:hypothetical protein BAR24_11130 [Gluconobacter oxydans]|nr:hypothetical protein B932_3008 [Gluconobacter oxydans H24]ANQ43089.1 hypothetical protein BAR24_11130 [Gluconobacter oxydans]
MQNLEGLGSDTTVCTSLTRNLPVAIVLDTFMGEKKFLCWELSRRCSDRNGNVGAIRAGEGAAVTTRILVMSGFRRKMTMIDASV